MKLSKQKILKDWVPDHAKVLDLGCGNGDLLRSLINEKSITGFGIENDMNKINECIKNDVPILQHDIDSGLKDFFGMGFDCVIMASSIQCLRNPKNAIRDILQIAEKCVITIPNFGYWKIRIGLLKGRMPISNTLPSKWFETKNIHLCTIKDFEELCKNENLNIIKKRYLKEDGVEIKRPKSPNFFAAEGVYLVGS